ncbi:MAG: hypothetical protein ACOY0T_26950 [Myxococcota bacterium]
MIHVVPAATGEETQSNDERARDSHAKSNHTPFGYVNCDWEGYYKGSLAWLLEHSDASPHALDGKRLALASVRLTGKFERRSIGRAEAVRPEYGARRR